MSHEIQCEFVQMFSCSTNIDFVTIDIKTFLFAHKKDSLCLRFLHMCVIAENFYEYFVFSFECVQFGKISLRRNNSQLDLRRFRFHILCRILNFETLQETVKLKFCINFD